MRRLPACALPPPGDAAASAAEPSCRFASNYRATAPRRERVSAVGGGRGQGAAGRRGCWAEAVTAQRLAATERSPGRWVQLLPPRVRGHWSTDIHRGCDGLGPCGRVPSVSAKGSLSNTELLMPPQLHQCTVGSFQSGARCAILLCARLGLLGTTLRAACSVERGTTACLAGPMGAGQGGPARPTG